MVSKFLLFYDPERWVYSDMTRDEYLLLAKYFAYATFGLFVLIYLIVRFW